MRNLLISILIIFGLIFSSLFLFWWLFFPLSVLSIFFFPKTAETFIASFALDLIYFANSGAKIPILSVFVCVIFILRIIFRDKLRLYGTS